VTALDLTLAVAAGGLIGPIIGSLIQVFYDAIEAVLRFVFGWFFVTKILEAQAAETYLVGYLDRGGGYNTGDEGFRYDHVNIKPLGERRFVWFREYTKNWKIYSRGRWPMLYLPNMGSPGARFIFLRGTIDFDQILKECEEHVHRETTSRMSKYRRFRVIRHYGSNKHSVYVHGRGENNPGIPPPSDGGKVAHIIEPRYAPVGWREEDIGEQVEGSRIADLSLTPELEAVIRRVRLWYRKKDWFRERGLPWTLGANFYGGTGCGKSTLIRAICEDLDVEVHSFDLASMNNEEFLRAWESTRTGADLRAVAFEDLDTVFHGRVPVNPRLELTFDTILNATNGIQREDGLLLFVTTNHIEHIDPALGRPEKDADGRTRSSRPGRIDICAEVLPLDHAGRVKLANRIVRDPVLAERLARAGEGDTATQFQDRAVQAALETFTFEDL
jgi:hypothetical protein